MSRCGSVTTASPASPTSGSGITYATLGPDGAPTDASTVTGSKLAYGPSLVLAPGTVPAVLYTRGSVAAAARNRIRRPTPALRRDVRGWVLEHERLTKRQVGGSLTVDPTSGELHVVLGDRALIHYSKAVGGNWKKETIVKSGAGSPVVRQDPTTGDLVVVYGGDKGIEVMTRR